MSSRSRWAAIWRSTTPSPGRKVASLVTVASSAFGLTAEEAAERVRAIAMLEKHPYRGISAARLNQFVHPSHQSDPDVVDVIRAMDRDLGKDLLLSQLRETSTRASLASRLPELGMPALYIGADGDPFVPWTSIEQMTALTPGARMIKAQTPDTCFRSNSQTGWPPTLRNFTARDDGANRRSGRVDRQVRCKNRQHRFGRLRLTKGVPDTLLPEDARRTGQRTQVIGASVRWRKQHEDQVGRTLVDRLEVGGLDQPGKAAHWPR